MDFDIKSFTNLITGKLTNWIEALIKLLPNIILAALILVLGLIVSKLAKKTALRIVSKISPSQTLNHLFGSVVYITCIGITIFTVLSILNLDKAVTSILAGAGIIGLALAFAFQDIAANFISGIFISFRKPLKVGDIVRIKNYMGKVQEVNLRDTVMLTFNGETVIIPNKDVFQNPIENFSYLGKRRLDLTVGVSYGENLENVRQITLEAVKDIEDISSTDEITLFFYEFGESSINFSLRIWINSTEQQIFKKVGNDAIMKIKNAYDKNSIVIPFPIRTLDFGIKGGKTLNEMEVKIKKN
ncbi:MAG: mechanosensitive ion channel [Ignavibacteria bacterium]